MTYAIFHDFPGLENGLPKFHDFPRRGGTLHITHGFTQKSFNCAGADNQMQNIKEETRTTKNPQKTKWT